MLAVNDSPNPYSFSCNAYQRHVIVNRTFMWKNGSLRCEYTNDLIHLINTYK